MAICSNFLFVRIHFILKLVVGSLIVGFYSWILFGSFDFLFEVRCESQQDVRLQQNGKRYEKKENEKWIKEQEHGKQIFEFHSIKIVMYL